MKVAENFELKEFDCHDGTPVPKEYEPNVIRLAANLQVLRDYVGKPIHINSSYRTAAYNKKVGGASKSQHLTASAADITIAGLMPKEVHAIILQLIKDGRMKQGGVGLYDTFVHYDIRGTEARWDLRKKK